MFPIKDKKNSLKEEPGSSFLPAHDTHAQTACNSSPLSFLCPPSALSFLIETGTLLHFPDTSHGLCTLYFLCPVWLSECLERILHLKSSRSVARNGVIRAEDLRVRLRNQLERLQTGDSEALGWLTVLFLNRLRNILCCRKTIQNKSSGFLSCILCRCWSCFSVLMFPDADAVGGNRLHRTDGRTVLPVSGQVWDRSACGQQQVKYVCYSNLCIILQPQQQLETSNKPSPANICSH